MTSLQTLHDQAGVFLTRLGFDAARTNKRSRLTLLALLGLRPDRSWSDSTRELKGVSQLMSYMSDHLDQTYAENSRETIRKETLRQFVEAGMVLYNADDPTRAVNSPNANYSITTEALKLAELFDSPAEFDEALTGYLEQLPGQVEARKETRDMARLEVTLPGGEQIDLSPGGQNPLIVAIINDFCSQYAPGGEVLYLGDADAKWRHKDDAKLAELGLTFDTHGKIPDLVVWYPDKQWLFLIEAVTTHGPIDLERKNQLFELFEPQRENLILVNCFETRKDMTRWLPELAWETEVWCASEPTHVMHLDGKRFLGPYKTT